MKAEWLEELVNAGGSPAEALRLPSTEPNKQVNFSLASLALVLEKAYHVNQAQQYAIQEKKWSCCD